MTSVRALVTGATGKVGHALAQALRQRGDEVRALVRDPARAAATLPAGVEPVRGDVTDAASVERGRCRLRAGLQRDGAARAVAGRRAGTSSASTRAAARPSCAPRPPPVPARRAHEHDRRLPRRAGRPLRRVARRRLPEGHRLRALQAAGRGARAGRRARTPAWRSCCVNPAAVYGPGPGGERHVARGGSVRAAGRGPARRRAGAAAGRPGGRLQRRARARPAAGRRARTPGRALHPLRHAS